MREKMSAFREALLASPWATLLVPLPCLPPILSGAVRYLTGVGFTLALLAALLAIAVFVAISGVPKIARGSRFAAIGTFVSMLALAAWCARLWWTPETFGMPNGFLGVDAGNHILNFHRFQQKQEVYGGFVGLYSLMHWYQKLIGFSLSPTLSTYLGLRFSHYAGLLTIPVVSSALVYPTLLTIKSKPAQALTLVLGVLVQAAMITVFVFPALQYYQADGFYAQIVGIYPFLLGFVLFGLCESGPQRLLICCFSIVLQRYVYVLNLADMLGAYALIWAWDARAIKNRVLRAGAYLFVPAAFYAGYVLLERLWAMRFQPGYFTQTSVGWVLPSQLLLSLWLFVAPELLAALCREVPETSTRLWRFAGLFGLINGALLVAYLGYGQPQMYYFLKYNLYAFVLVGIAASGPVVALLGHLLTLPGTSSSWGKPLAFALSTLIFVLGVGTALSHGQKPYVDQAKERFEHTVPGALLFSNYEPHVDDFIDRTLRKRKRKFGGYQDYYWPRMFMMNALRNEFSTGPDYEYNFAFNRGDRMFEVKKGYCYFIFGYYNKDYFPVRPLPMGKQFLTWFNDRSGCEDVFVRSTGRRSRVCSACY